MTCEDNTHPDPAWNPKAVSVIIPAYNEQARLGPTLEKITTYLRENGWDFEVIVVDDGSLDGTAAVAGRFAGKCPAVRVLGNRVNRGKGYSVRRGMTEANRPLLLFSDSDLSTPIEDIEKLHPWIALGHDVVIGSRAVPDSRVEIRQSRIRESLGRIFGWIVRRTFRLETRDTQCGFKLFTAKAGRSIFGRQEIDGYAFDVELLLLARQLGFRVKEVGIRWRNDPSSQVSLVRTPIRMLRELLILRGKFNDSHACPRIGG